MKVALYERPHQLRVTNKGLRTLRPGELLVKVAACGVCGTDVHIVEGSSRSTPPVVLGHEYAGTIEDANGSGVFHNGDPVAIDPNISCGTCFYCRRGLIHLCSNLRALGVDIDGGMAEFCIVPEGQLYAIPKNLSIVESAFIEPISCAVHGIDRANINIGDTVVILGGGTIGLITMQLARHAGATRLILVEPLEPKRHLARELGADITIDPNERDIVEAIKDISTVGADVVIECVGRPETMQQSLQLARRGGTVEFFGVCPIGQKIPVEPNFIYARELMVVGSYVNPHTFARSIALLGSENVRVDLFETHQFPIDGVHEALRYQQQGLTIKSIITPHA